MSVDEQLNDRCFMTIAVGSLVRFNRSVSCFPVGQLGIIDVPMGALSIVVSTRELTYTPYDPLNKTVAQITGTFIYLRVMVGGVVIETTARCLDLIDDNE